MGILKFSLSEEEKPLFIARMHWSVYLRLLFYFLFFSFFLGLIIFFLMPFWWEDKFGRIGLLVFLSLGFLYILFKVWKMALTNYIITPFRIIDITQEKVLKRVITEIPLEEVCDFEVQEKNWFDKMCKKGSLVIKVAENKGKIIFHDIPEPEKAFLELEKIRKDKSEIISREKQPCSVILESNKIQKVPLTYSYFGVKGKSDKNVSLNKKILKNKKNEEKN